MSIKLISAEQLSALAETVKDKINVLDTVPATVNGGLWIDGGGSVPVIKLLYNGNIYQTSTELVPAPVTPVNPVTPAEQFTFTVLDQLTDEATYIEEMLFDWQDGSDGEVYNYPCEEIVTALQAYATKFTLEEISSVLFSGDIPDEPTEIEFMPANPLLSGVVLLVFIVDEDPSEQYVVEAQYDDVATAEIPITIIANLLGRATTMVVLQSVAEE